MLLRNKIFQNPILLKKSFDLLKKRQNSNNFLNDINCKVALIYGGSGGIGHEIAHHLLAEKAKFVALLGLDLCQGKDSIEKLNHRFGKGKAMFIKSDIQCEFNLSDSFKVVEKEFGKIDIVINCAGIIDGKKWENEIFTNYLGTFRSTWFTYKNMDKNKGGQGGTILNIAGIFGLETLPSAPHMAGNMAGIIGFSRSFGDNYQRSGVRVITLCPGITKTNLLEDIENKGLDMEMGKQLANTICKMTKQQNPRVCGKAAVHILKYAQSATIWVIENSNLYRVDTPYWKNYSVLVSQFM